MRRLVALHQQLRTMQHTHTRQQLGTTPAWGGSAAVGGWQHCSRHQMQLQLAGVHGSRQHQHHIQALHACRQLAAVPPLHDQPCRTGRPTTSSSSSSSSVCALARPLCWAPSAGASSSSISSSSSRRRLSVVTAAGLPFSLSRPPKVLQFKWARRYPGVRVDELQVEVDALSEGRPAGLSAKQVQDLLQQLEGDAAAAVPLALVAKQAAQPAYRLPAIANLSLVLCDDAHIRRLNAEHRGKDAPTDVLSFEMPDEAPGLQLPVKLLGDLVISLDTASRQAAERGHSLLTELRVLLVHGLLHLAGFDHEQGEQQLQEMVQQEARLLSELGWDGSGLISLAASSAELDDDAGPGASTSSSTPSSSSTLSSSTPSSSSSSRAGSAGPCRLPRVPLVALDMDGTLLDSSSNIRPDSAEVIRAAAAAGVKVILATGKARPAAIAACKKAGLEGDDLLVSPRRPGVFLQGLAVHGHQGQQLSDAALPASVVRQAFAWVAQQQPGVSCVAFLGDECATLQLTDDLVELHTRYYEPLARAHSSIEQLLAGPAVRKLLFMAPPDVVDGLLKPHWGGAALRGQAAEVLQAVPNMLEVVPAGVNKWAGLRVLLEHLQLAPEQLMAVGDGSNDLEMVTHAGIGVAMSNGVPSVRSAADVVVASNDDGGIVEAFERFVL